MLSECGRREQKVYFQLSDYMGMRSARQARAGEAREGWWEAPLASWSDRDVELLEILVRSSGE
jgi:hypothetical protein